MKKYEEADHLTSRDIQAIERKEQLLNAAKELFALQGYHATTIRQITRHIGMADGLIYHYFPEGKQQMLDTILKSFLEERYEFVEKDIANLNGNMPIEELLMSLGTIFFSYIGKDKNVLLILLKEKNVFSGIYTKLFHKHVDLLLEQMKELIQGYVDRKEIRSFDIFMMVNQFWSSIYAYLVQDIFFEENNMYHCNQETYLKEIVKHTLMTWKI